jgi:predicted lipoprotein with Yx(FWY)xxD motif
MRARLIRWVLPLLLVTVAGAGVAMAASARSHSSRATVATAANAKFGTILVAANGRTLYRYTPDRKGVNRCSADATCNKFWPRFTVKAGVKPTAGTGVKPALVGTIKATNGMRQVTYAGFPLYYFAGDKRAGQVKGQGFDGIWYVVNTKGALVKHAMTAAPPTATTTPTTTSSGGGGGTWG